jgi:hypothetical protein
MKRAIWLLAAFLFAIVVTVPFLAQNNTDTKEWISLFNGKNLDGWVPKIAGYPLGENYGDTFRVENGILKVSYDKYPEFGDKFGTCSTNRNSDTTFSWRSIDSLGAGKGRPVLGLRNNG